MRGDAVGQAEVAGEPVPLGVAVGCHGGPGLGPREDGTEGETEDIEEFVTPGGFATRVDQAGEVMP